MEQRKGRAGRVQPGESFHLYTRSAYEKLNKYSTPEILRTSLTKVVLDSKIYSCNMNALKFFNQMLSPPDENTITTAVTELKELDLIDDNENLTSLGKTLVNFQLEPKLSKAMVNAVVFKCTTPVVDVITLFSTSSELFSTGLVDKENVRNIKETFSVNSDHIALMKLFETWLDYVENGHIQLAQEFCEINNLVPHKMRTIQRKL